MQYLKYIFGIQFLKWRKKKLKYDYIDSTYDFDGEIKRAFGMCKSYEKFLFEDLDEASVELIMNADSNIVSTTAL